MSKDNFDTLDNAPTMPGEPEGQILSGQYKIIRQIGSGGMGTVYLAQDMELDNEVAVKVLPAILANNKRAIDNLRREAKTALKLSHHNIVRLRTFQSDEAIKYLVMEYIDGGNLEERISAAGALSVDETIKIFSQVAAGLDYAHSQNVLHRDIKPANIMLTRSGTAKLADFGIARQLKDSMTRITGKETSGTLLYMAPEQFRGNEPDHRSDIYSLAASIYECLSGKPPFCRGSIEYQIINVAPEPLNKLNQKQNSALLKALSKEPDKRQNSAKELLADLGADYKTINWQPLSKVREKKSQESTLDYAKTISPRKEWKHKGAVLKALTKAAKTFAVVVILTLLVAGIFRINEKYHVVEKAKVLVCKLIDRWFGAEKIWNDANDTAQKGNYARAIKLLDELISKYPNTEYERKAKEIKPAWIKKYAEMLAQKGDYVQAINLLDELIDNYPNTEYEQWAKETKPKWEKDNAIAVFQKGGYAQAIELLDGIISKYPDTDPVVKWAKETKPAWGKEYAKILFQKDDYDQAIKLLDEIISEYPDTDSVVQWAKETKPEWEKKKQIKDSLSHAQDFISKEQFSEASDCVVKVLKIDSENEEAKRLQAVIGREQQFKAFLKDGNDAETLQEWEKAKEAYNQALNIKPDNAGVKDKLNNCQYNVYLSKAETAREQAETAREQKDWEEASINYREALKYKYVAETEAKLIEVEKQLQRLQEYLKWVTDARKAEKDAEKNAGKEGSLPALYKAVKCYEEALKYADDESLREETNKKIKPLKSEIDEIEKKRKFDGLLSLAIGYYKEKRCIEARKAVNDAIALYPNNQVALDLKEKIIKDCNEKIITNSIGMQLMSISPGTFSMGSPPSEQGDSDEHPQHEVKISRYFYIGIYEVTQRQYQKIMGNNPSEFDGDDLPEEQVSWNDANEFCKRLSQKEGEHYRLPTEAEWEYACRAGTTTAFNHGQNGLTTIRPICWCSDNGILGSARQTKPVSSYNPNTWGLYDMHGNVWEWCQDWYDENYYSQSPSVDPQGQSSGSTRVLRGGSWYDTPKDCRSAKRDCLKPDNSRDKIGFRVVREAD